MGGELVDVLLRGWLIPVLGKLSQWLSHVFQIIHQYLMIKGVEVCSPLVLVWLLLFFFLRTSARASASFFLYYSSPIVALTAFLCFATYSGAMS